MNMKKVFCFLFGIIFFILGCIGLILPVIPQIPFFIVSVFFLAESSSRIKNAALKNKYYKRLTEKYAAKK